MPDRLKILFLKTFVVVAPDILIPVIVAAAVEDRLLIAFMLTFVTVDGDATERPTTDPAVEEIVFIVLLFTSNDAALLELPIVMAVTAAPQLIFVIVLLLTELEPPKKLIVIGLIEPVPPLILLNVFPEIVFVGEPPSVLFIPTKLAEPDKVILEKLLFCILIIDPVTELEFELNTVTVPPAPVLAKAVTMELPFIVWVPPAVGTEIAFDIKVMLPEVEADILVNVLLLMVVFK